VCISFYDQFTSINKYYYYLFQNSFVISAMKQFQFRFKEMTSCLKSVFTERTEEASAVQYFQVNSPVYVAMRCTWLICMYILNYGTVHKNTNFVLEVMNKVLK
jgi:hypothetical protein